MSIDPIADKILKQLDAAGKPLRLEVWFELCLKISSEASQRAQAAREDLQKTNTSAKKD